MHFSKNLMQFLTNLHIPSESLPFLNLASRHEDVCGSGGKVPRILNLST
jgi:hypothetical protein